MAAQRAFKRIKATRLIDGLGDRPVENGAVLVADSHISQVGAEKDVVLPEGAAVEEFDYPNATLLPGLIDIHCHFNYLGDGTHTDDVMALPDDILLMRSALTARIHLESGVTTARETGAKHDTTFSLRDAIRLGLAKGPRLVLCGNPVTVTGGHMWQMGSEADGVDGVRAAVRSLIKRGADWIKVPATGGSTRSSFPLRTSYTVEELRAICDEAHNYGKLVGAHCGNTAGIVNSLDAGVDMIIHVLFQEADGAFNFRQDVAERIAREGTLMNPTLHISRSRVNFLEEKVKCTGNPANRLELEAAKLNSEVQWEHARRLDQMGVRLISGSDSGFSWYPFGGFAYELESLVQLGFTPIRAIGTATGEASQAIGLSDIVGTLEVGKEADLLVVAGNASEDINALHNVLAVFQGGVQVK